MPRWLQELDGKDDVFKEKFKVFRNVSKNFFVHFQEEYIPCIKCIKNKETVLASIGLIIEQSLVFWIKFDELFPRTTLFFAARSFAARSLAPRKNVSLGPSVPIPMSVGGSFAAAWARVVLKKCSSERWGREKRF